jgi:hypothetical protein
VDVDVKLKAAILEFTRMPVLTEWVPEALGEVLAEVADPGCVGLGI